MNPIYSHPSFSGLVGVARGDITPPLGIYARNWGAALHDTAEKIHRPFTATALTLQSAPDEMPLVLIALDLGWWRTREDEWVLRGALLEELGLDPACVMMNLSHTHAGPSLCRADIDKTGGEFIAPYLDSVRDTVIKITREALASARAATLEWRMGTCDLAAQRDLPDPQKPRFVCGFNPEGDADKTLLIGRVSDENGIVATVANYACHPTVLAWQCRELSPEFPAAMREVVETETGAPCLFLQGASGELAPREQYTGDVAVTDRHGRELGFAVLSLLAGMNAPNSALCYDGVQESGAPLAVWKNVALENLAPQTAPESRPEFGRTFLGAQLIQVELELKEMPSAQQLEAELDACRDRVLGERLRRKMHIRHAVGDGQTTRVPLWIWRAGDTVFVGHNNEAYSHLQRELRAAFPDLAIIVMNLVNGATGYLPPAELYDEDLYAVWQTPFARGGMERLIQAAHREIEKLGR